MFEKFRAQRHDLVCLKNARPDLREAVSHLTCVAQVIFKKPQYSEDKKATQCASLMNGRMYCSKV